MRLSIDGVERVFAPEVLVVIGYAGRDRARGPSTTSTNWPLSACPARPASRCSWCSQPWLISQEPSISVAGSESSGEAEIVSGGRR